MPEGHVIHRISNTLNAHLLGHSVRSTSPQGKFAGAPDVDGREFTGAEAFGKHLFVGFDGLRERVNIHLGLLGKFFFADAFEPEETGQIRWRLATEEPPWTMDLRGPNVCELRSPDQVASIMSALGPDPLRPDSDPERAWTRIHRSAAPVGTLCMDQKIFAGVGNIYRAEALYRHRLDPFMAGKFLRRPEFEAIWDDFVELMPLGVRDGRIDTVYPEHTPEAMGRPARVDAHGGEVYVYRRADLPCLVCGTPVSTTVLAGRNLFWCRMCQPRSRRRVVR